MRRVISVTVTGALPGGAQKSSRYAFLHRARVVGDGWQPARVRTDFALLPFTAFLILLYPPAGIRTRDQCVKFPLARTAALNAYKRNACVNLQFQVVLAYEVHFGGHVVAHANFSKTTLLFSRTI